jgi:hypothetical protein
MGGCVKRFVAAIGACILFANVACSDVSFVEVVIINDTNYPVDVNVTDKSKDGWLGLTLVGAQSTTTDERVIDQGEVWVFRFDYIGKYEEEVEISRDELARSDWTIRVPQSLEDRLREMDVPTPP